jgi:hypothetical protein
MAKLTRLELTAHVVLALTASALGIILSVILGVPPYSFLMALVVIAILIPAEFVAVIIWDRHGKHSREATAGTLPSRAKTNGPPAGEALPTRSDGGVGIGERDRLQDLSAHDREQLQGTWRFSYRFLTISFGLMGLTAFILRHDLGFLIDIMVMDAVILALIYAGLFFYVPWTERFGRNWRLRRQGVVVPQRPPRISPKWKVVIGAALVIVFLIGLMGFVVNTARDSGIASLPFVGVLFYVIFVVAGTLIVADGLNGVRSTSRAIGSEIKTR